MRTRGEPSRQVSFLSQYASGRGERCSKIPHESQGINQASQSQVPRLTAHRSRVLSHPLSLSSFLLHPISLPLSSSLRHMLNKFTGSIVQIPDCLLPSGKSFFSLSYAILYCRILLSHSLQSFRVGYHLTNPSFLLFKTTQFIRPGSGFGFWFWFCLSG